MKTGWEYKKLGELGRVVTGSTPSTKDTKNYETNDVCFIKPSDISGNGINYLKDSEYYISEYAYNNSRQLPKGSVLTTCIGIIGKVAILEIDATCNQQINAIVPNNDVDSKFLAYSIISQRYLMQSMANAPVVPLLNKTQFSGFSIPVPPLPTQQSIVSELDSLSKIIADCKETLKDYDALEQSIFYDMFGDPVKNEKGWEVKKVIDVVTMQRGFDLPTSNRNSDGEIPVYGSNGILGKHDKSKLDEGIITGRSGSIGEVFVSFVPFWPLNTTLFSKDTHNNNIVYLQYLLRNFNLKRFAEGAGVPTLNRNNFHNENIIAPPLPLQQTFASKIEAIEQMKAESKAALQETETLFQARMDYWFN